MWANLPHIISHSYSVVFLEVHSLHERMYSLCWILDSHLDGADRTNREQFYNNHWHLFLVVSVVLTVQSPQKGPSLSLHRQALKSQHSTLLTRLVFTYKYHQEQFQNESWVLGLSCWSIMYSSNQKSFFIGAGSLRKVHLLLTRCLIS